MFSVLVWFKCVFSLISYVTDLFNSGSFVWLQVILSGDVSDVGGFRLFRSQDFGLTFVSTDLPFEPLIQILYNPGDCNKLLTLSIMVYSQGFGVSIKENLSSPEVNDFLISQLGMGKY